MKWQQYNNTIKSALNVMIDCISQNIHIGFGITALCCVLISFLIIVEEKLSKLIFMY